MYRPLKVIVILVIIATLCVSIAVSLFLPSHSKQANQLTENKSSTEPNTLYSPETIEPHEGEIPPEINELFGQITHFMEWPSLDDAKKLIDVPLQSEQILRQPCVTQMVDRDGIQKTLEFLIQKQIVKFASKTYIHQSKSNIRSLGWLGNGERGVLEMSHILPMENQDDHVMLIRWWIVRRDREWRIYDFEEVGHGEKNSESVAALLCSGLQRLQIRRELEAYSDFVDQICDAKRAILSEKFAKGLYLLNLPLPDYLPSNFRASIGLYKAIGYHRVGEWQDALRYLEIARELNPKLSAALIVRASVFNAIGKHEEALAAAKQAMREVGPLPSSLLEIAISLAGLNRCDEAIKMFDRRCAMHPVSVEELAIFRKCFPSGRKSEFAKRVADLPKSSKSIFKLFEVAMTEKDFESAEELVKIFIRVEPNHPASLVAAGKLAMIRDQDKEAVRYFIEAYQLASGTNEHYIEELTLNQSISAFCELKSITDAYEQLSVTNARLVFRILIQRLSPNIAFGDPNALAVAKGKKETFEKLAAMHRLRVPEDHWVNFALAESKFEANDIAGAEELFGKTRQASLDFADRLEACNRQVDCLCRLNRGLHAFEYVDSSANTFEMVARFFEAERNVDQLTKLIAIAEQKQPASRYLNLGRGQLCWMKKDYEGAIAHYSKVTDGGSERYIEIAQARIFRSLLRQGKLNDAAKIIDPKERFTEKGTLRIALLAANKGDAAALGRALDRLNRLGFKSNKMHADEDLGPVLRSKPEYKILLEKYPVPKQDPQAEKKT